MRLLARAKLSMRSSTHHHLLSAMRARVRTNSTIRSEEDQIEPTLISASAARLIAGGEEFESTVASIFAITAAPASVVSALAR